MIDEKDLRILKLFKCLSNGVRYEIIKLLKSTKYSVNEIAVLLNKTPENISQHLRILRDFNLVRYQTKNNSVIYSLKNKEVLKVINIAEEILKRH